MKIYICELQKETLLLVDDLINKNKTHNDIWNVLIEKGYEFMVESKNGYTSKTKMKLYKNGEYSFLDLIKRKNGLAYWETIKLS